MTDFVKYQRHLTRLHHTGSMFILFINTAIVSNK